MTTRGITILRARRSDLDLVVRIENECFLPEDRFTPRVLRYLVEQAEGGCFTAAIGGRTVGYLSLLKRENCHNVRIYSIAVLQEAQGCGVGSALIEYAIDYAVRSGYERLTLEVRTDNEAAIRLYRSYGFKTLKTLKGYYHDGCDALKMGLDSLGAER
ncbi:MAG: ribosomal protein S18-alanine N-acetyltransferase [Tidjanibacter sp.]|nr:ribosomal protein S18-alanine N-acetyltransferase [Tidjanibacter sp.]